MSCEVVDQTSWAATHRVLVFIPSRRCAASFNVMLQADGCAYTHGAYTRGDAVSLRWRPGGVWTIPVDSDLPDADRALVFRVRPLSEQIAHWEALAM